MTELKNRKEGQGLVEYALILVLVAVIVIAILTLLGPQVGNVFSRVVHGLDSASATGGSGGGGGGGTTPTGNITAVNAFRGGTDVVVQVQVSAAVTVTAVDSQSGQTVSTNCNLACNISLPNVGPNVGTVTVTAAGGNSMSDDYPVQN